MSGPNSSYQAFRRWARSTLAHVAGVHGGGEGVAREVYQTSTMGALLDGVYDGDVTIGELLRHGDFGLGTFNRLDGEMLILDGVCYHLRADGSARIADPADRTPFAAVTWFTPDTTIPVPPGSDHAAVKALVDGAVASVNLMYAVLLTGTFREIRARSELHLSLPRTPQFLASDLTPANIATQIRQAEGG